MDLTNKNQLIQYLQSHGLYTQKKLGQNFLVDRGALNKIVDAAELSSDDCVIEVGPGLGVMTEELVKKAGKVIAVELDRKLAKLLGERIKNQELRIKEEEQKNINLEIINQDILRVNIAELTKNYQKYKVVANIPYYITSKILRLFLEAEKKPETIVLLTQKEVAERIVAEPGDMSVLSVSVQYYGEPEIVGIVPRTSFFPAPEVDSAILKIKVTSNGNGNDARIEEGLRQTSPLDETGLVTDKRETIDKDFFRCVHIGFASRRKTLLNNLSAGYHLDKKITLDILTSVGLTDKTRAQELSIEEWMRLYSAIVF